MNIYKLLKIASGKNIPSWAKLLGLWGMHLTGRRHIGVFLDPVPVCNLRCRMCLFSSPSARSGQRTAVLR